MRALVKLVTAMLIGIFGLLLVICAGSIMLAIAIPKFGRELGYHQTLGGQGPMTVVNVLPMLGFALMLLFVLAIVVLAMRMAGGEPGRAKSKENADETRLIQELYHGLGRMEQRVEALETLLLERSADPPLFARTAYREALRDKE
jgi:phage shock protein B